MSDQEALRVICHCCGGYIMWKRLNDTEITVFHDCTSKHGNGLMAARLCAKIAFEEAKRWEDSNQYGRAQRSSTATDIYMKILQRFGIDPKEVSRV